MATITLTIPDEVLSDVIESLCAAAGGYQAELTSPDGTVTPNPLTKPQFAKYVLAQSVKNRYLQYMRGVDEAALPTRVSPDIS